MNLTYNGVRLNLVTLEPVNREAVWTPDGTDLLYVKWRIGASCIYAPGGTGLSRDPGTFGRTYRNGFKGSNPQLITADADLMTGPIVTSPIVTDIYLRKLLFQQRRTLIISGYSSNSGEEIVWLQSPIAPATYDANNGPKVHSCNVVGITGMPGHFAVQLEIETSTPPVESGSDRPLLAHRWQMRHTHDENYYLTRAVTGQAIFHPGLIDHYAQNPDTFRAQLFHPIPLGFKRTLGPIDMSPDNCVLQYQYMDTDTTIMFDAADSGATAIDVQEKAVYVSAGIQKIFGLS